MEALTIINGVSDEGMHEQIERYAFCEGILTCTLERFLEMGNLERGRELFVLMDEKGRQKIPKDQEPLLAMKCPVVLLGPPAKKGVPDGSMSHIRLPKASFKSWPGFTRSRNCGKTGRWSSVLWRLIRPGARYGSREIP